MVLPQAFDILKTTGRQVDSVLGNGLASIALCPLFALVQLNLLCNSSRLHTSISTQTFQCPLSPNKILTSGERSGNMVAVDEKSSRL